MSLQLASDNLEVIVRTKYFGVVYGHLWSVAAYLIVILCCYHSVLIWKFLQKGETLDVDAKKGARRPDLKALVKASQFVVPLTFFFCV